MSPAWTRSSSQSRPGLSPGPQFNVTAGRLTNLDRCNLCGRPRSAHGADWTCGRPSQVSHLVVAVVVAAALALGGIGLLAATSATATSLGSLGASCCLAGLTLLIAAVVLTGRRR
jgi:hypothetical protein